ncbi:MAG TPA: type IV toxin-antitoxin system AbiEi family antitoxin [Solirubrobacteraceae bacterium]
MSSRASVIRRFAEAGPSVLADGQGIDVEVLDDRRATIGLRGAGGVSSFKAVGLAVPYPSGLRRLRSELPDIELVVVERAPEGLRAAARREGISWIDLDGAGHIETGGRVILDASPAQRRPPGRPAVSPFAPAASRVIKVLLSDHRRPWRLSEIVDLAEVNPGNVHRVLGALLERGFVERDVNAYMPMDPRRMLDAWAEQYETPRERVIARVEEDLAPLVDKLVASRSKVFVSGELAAELLVPYLPARSAVIHCVDPEAFLELAQELDVLSCDSKIPREIVIDLADRGCGAFAERHAGLPIASPVQIYLDMSRELDRGREAAEQLRREAIGF